jgi:hypothetical protein
MALEDEGWVVDELVGTFGARWYVTAFGVVFLVAAVRHLGVKRTAIRIPTPHYW